MANTCLYIVFSVFYINLYVKYLFQENEDPDIEESMEDKTDETD